jgi:hypothetical protein
MVIACMTAMQTQDDLYYGLPASVTENAPRSERSFTKFKDIEQWRHINIASTSAGERYQGIWET